MGEINALDSRVEQAVERYNLANVKLQRIGRDLTRARFELRIARVNLKRAQTNLAEQAVAVYTSSDSNSTLEVLFGASSLDDLLNRMDAVYDSPLGDTVRLKEKPSYYFYRQCWISGDPDEKAFGNVVDFVGADKFFWASDFPHFDHPGNYMDELRELVEPMSETTRQKVIGENVAKVYEI